METSWICRLRNMVGNAAVRQAVSLRVDTRVGGNYMPFSLSPSFQIAVKSNMDDIPRFNLHQLKAL
jgi:hypothetical protein